MFTQRATARMISLAASLKLRKHRKNEGLFLLEGERLVKDALVEKVGLRFLLVSDSRVGRYDRIIRQCDTHNIPVFFITDQQFYKLADTRQPQGIVAVAPLPSEAEADDPALISETPVVALSEISDPGNLGTIIRTMDWFGVHLLLLSSGSVDPWSPKVVRSAMGSIFRVRIRRFQKVDELEAITASYNRSAIAAVAAAGVPLPELPVPTRPLLLFGSEAHGLSEQALASTAFRVTIPGRGAAESLNLAMSVSIMLYGFHIANRRCPNTA